MADIPTRHSIYHLQTEYENGNTQPLNDLWKAWAGIKALPTST